VPHFDRVNCSCTPRRLLTRFRRGPAGTVAGAMALASIAVGAPAGAASPDVNRTAGVADICQRVIGLEPGRAQYEACVLSLADSLRDRDRVALQSSGAPPASSGSYFYASEREIHRREQLSCARLGFQPADGAFADCVADLDGRLFVADNPAQ
jgi:hypothetical protein